MIAAQATPEAAERPLPPVIAFSGLSKTFGTNRVLTNVDFDVRGGEVHCLLGHNGSGKSTLIKILGGIHSPDEGSRLALNGVAQALPMSPRQILSAGIRFVHQSLGLIPSLSVAEHLAQDRLEGAPGWHLSPRAAIAAAREALATFDVRVDPAALIEELSAVDRALVAIVRAVASLERRPDGIAGTLLILDEPTAFLPRAEVETLFRTVRHIAARGAGVVLVTHDTDEVLSIADRVTVLRDGKVAGVVPRADLSRDGLVRLIVGHELTSSRPAARAGGGEPALEVALHDAGLVKELSFSATKGEIVGLTGLIGSGYSDAVHALFGSRPGAGRLRLGRHEIDLARITPRAAIDRRIAFVPSDRPGAGAALELLVAENAAILSLGRVVNPLFFGAGKLQAGVTDWLRDAGVRPLNPALEMGRLSGGNQQKVVLAKWLSAEPELLLLDEPTQGIDIGAREQIFGLLRKLAARGTTILCSSTDHEQLAELCDRVLILSQGRLVRDMPREELTPHNIGEAVLSATAAPQDRSTDHG